MPYILDSTSDLSSIATGLNLAVPAGCTWFSLFGKTLTQSLTNYANPAAPVSVTGSPALGPNSGSTVDSTDFLTAPVGPLTTSETLMIVFQAVLSGTVFRSLPIGDFVSDYNHSLVIDVDSGSAAMAAFIGSLDSNNNPVLLSSGAGIAAMNENLHTGAPNTLAILAVPQLYSLTIDMVNREVTFENMSQASGDATWKSTAAIPAGYTRAPNLTPYNMICTNPPPSNSTTTVHAAAQWNRALSAAERTTAYNQVKAILAHRGVNV